MEVQAFDFETEQFEVVDSVVASQSQDQVILTNINENAVRFVESDSGAMRIRLRFTAAQNRQRFSVNIDQVKLLADR